MKIVHISDSHGDHEQLQIPECDVLIHSGDIAWRTTPAELMVFLVWMEQQPAKVKLFVAGNHDICLDKQYVATEYLRGSVEGLLARQKNQDALSLLNSYKIKYLCNTDYVYEGIKFYGSPYSPTFGNGWAFNEDRGHNIATIWGRIPSDVNVLITHTPPYNVLDHVNERDKRYAEEDTNVGCKDLYQVIRKRLLNLQLHCFGHIHDQYGLLLKAVSNKRNVLFSNAAAVSYEDKKFMSNPFIITI